jgi:hypothetical protein
MFLVLVWKAMHSAASRSYRLSAVLSSFKKSGTATQVDAHQRVTCPSSTFACNILILTLLRSYDGQYGHLPSFEPSLNSHTPMLRATLLCAMVERFEVSFISFVESSSDPSLHKWNENALRHHDRG